MDHTRLGSRLGAAPSWCLTAWCLAAATSACDSASSEVPLRITAYGEEFIEDRIPADELEDGWTIEFSRFLVAIGDVEANGVALPGSFVIDLSEASSGEGHELGVVLLPAEDHPHLDFSVRPVSEAEEISATDDDRALMLDRGLSILAEGEATRGTETLHFSWGFANTTRYAQCHGAAELASEIEPRSQLTIHADHLFYDDLDSEEPNVAFDLIASADADDDGEVTPAELRAIDITAQARYQVGSRDIGDLWHFIEAQTGTLGHIDGEGHCELAD